ncbi:hypothetical protein CTA1_3517 [Colletotrichum tanaceti]|uniref:Uncharacterized protein n=1 Tax=Colletotrichum tanaceti TaxID=1306861 RepID=A0A4U6XLQ4_9PEZI|nr:hypothetical protein CTA1_3517 [Colletotrichum tanaceti]
MMIPSHAGLSLTLFSPSTAVNLASPAATMMTPMPTAVVNEIVNEVKPGHQNLAKPHRPLRHDGGPLPDASAGPLSAAEELLADIDALTRRDDKKECVAVYLCTEENWRGVCHRACFDGGHHMYLRPQWRSRIKSVRTGEGAECKFFL